MKFRKRPVVIEAIQWLGNNYEQLGDWVWDRCGQRPGEGSNIDTQNGFLTIHTLEGVMTASVNDWIICGVSKEFYPCKPEIFEKTYEKVE